MLSDVFATSGDSASLLWLLVALAYAIAFVAIAQRRPALALGITFGSAHFSNDLGIGPVNIALGEFNTCLLCIAILLRPGGAVGFFRMGPLGLGVAAYLAVSVVATLSDLDSTAITALIQMAVYLVVAVLTFATYASNLKYIQLALDVFIGVSLVACVVVISGTAAFPILVQHKNASGASLAAAFIVALEFWLTSERGSRRRKLLMASMAVIAVGVMFTLSRGGWLSAIFGSLVLIVMRRQYLLVMKAALVLVPLLAIAWTSLPQDSRDFATSFETGRENIKARLRFLETSSERFQRDPILGTGVAFRKEADATNIVMSTLAETGIIGLITFAAMHVALLRLVRTAHHNLPEHDFSKTVLRLTVALILGRLAHGMVDHYWSRGTLVVSWAMAGVAVGIWRLQQDQAYRLPVASWPARRRRLEDPRSEMLPRASR